MAQTKQFFIDKAYSELGLAAYVFDLEPEDYQYAVGVANAMMAEWEGQGVHAGDWPIPDDPTADTMQTVVAIPATNWRAIWTSLALALAPSAGKQPEQATAAYAKLAFERLLVRRVEIPQMQRPQTMPIGTGWNRGIKDRQFYQQTQALTDGAGQSLGVDVWDRGDDPQPVPNPTP